MTTGERIWIPPEWSGLILVQPASIGKMASEKMSNLGLAAVTIASDETQSCLSFGQGAAWKGSESWICE